MNDSTNGMAPEEAIELFLEDLDADSSIDPGTVNDYRSLLGFFEEFCGRRDIDDLSTLSASDLRKWKHWRRTRGNDLADGERLAPKTLYDDLYMTRRFVKWLSRMEIVPFRMIDKVDTIQIDDEDEVRFETLDADAADEILDYYETAAPADTHHTLMLLDWHTAMRLCELHSIDLKDIKDGKDEDSGERGLYIKLRHRPETGTKLKHGAKSERKVAIDPRVKAVIDRFIEYHRPDVEDEYGREPLFASEYGRRSKSNLREYVYQATQPCQIGKECPHGRDPKACDAAIRRNDASKCPTSVSPHAIRKGVITHWRDEGVPREEISGRCDVSEDVIEKHYDQRSETQRMEQRREFFV